MAAAAAEWQRSLGQVGAAAEALQADAQRWQHQAAALAEQAARVEALRAAQEAAAAAAQVRPAGSVHNGICVTHTRGLGEAGWTRCALRRRWRQQRPGCALLAAGCMMACDPGLGGADATASEHVREPVSAEC